MSKEKSTLSKQQESDILLEKELKKTIETYIPSGEIPAILNVQPISYWHETDSPNAAIYKDTIEYKRNSKGYRCPEFDVESDFKIVSVGCSWVFGHGLNQEFLFHEIFSKKIPNSINWNLSRGGKSNDYICRICQLSLPILKPHLLIVNFTRLSRREYFNVNGECLGYCPNFKGSNFNFENDNISKLTSPHDDIINFWHNLKSITSLCHQMKCNFLWSYIEDPLITDENCVGAFEKLDLARDGLHPGKLSNLHLCEKYSNKYNLSIKTPKLNKQTFL